MTPNPNLMRLREAGVSIWLDTLSRQLLDSGEFDELIRDFGVSGATSNPTIFAKAIAGSDLYDGQLRGLAAAGEEDTEELFFAIALDDVRDAADLLRPEFDRTSGADGFISFECTPDLADDTEVANQLGELAAVQQLAREGVEPDRYARFAEPREVRIRSHSDRWPWSGVSALHQAQKLVPRPLIITDRTVQRGRHGPGARLLNAAQRHARVLCLQHHPDPLRPQLGL